MLRLLVCAVLLHLAVAAQSYAQFHVVESVPAVGATDVPVESVIRIQFDQAVSTDNDFNRAFVVQPRRKIEITQVALLVPDLSRPAGPNNPPSVVEFTVRHEPDTDYTWLVYALRSAQSEYVTSPFELRYTTSSTAGIHTVKGNAADSSPAAAKADVLSDRGRAFLRWGAELLERSMKVEPGATPIAGAAATSSLEPHTQVLLLDEFDVRRERWDVRAAAVTNADEGSFAVDYVRDGTYWPLAVRYEDEKHLTIEALGFYDADGDGTPDSIVVDKSLDGIDLQLYPYAPTTAMAQLPTARSAADALDLENSPRLQLIDSRHGTRADGRAHGWSFQFYEGASDSVFVVHTDPLGVEAIDARQATTAQRIIEPIPEAFIDSDAALRIALDMGGNDVIEGYRPEGITVTVLGGNRHWLLPRHDVIAFWDVYLLATSSTGTRSFDVRIDMKTGEEVIVSRENEPSRAGPLIAPLYPNPASTTASVPLHLDAPADVVLTIYDGLGREVARPFAGRSPVGRYDIEVDVSRLPAGVYFCTIQVDGKIESRSLVVL